MWVGVMLPAPGMWASAPMLPLAPTALAMLWASEPDRLESPGRVGCFQRARRRRFPGTVGSQVAAVASLWSSFTSETAPNSFLGALRLGTHSRPHFALFFQMLSSDAHHLFRPPQHRLHRNLELFCSEQTFFLVGSFLMAALALASLTQSPTHVANLGKSSTFANRPTSAIAAIVEATGPPMDPTSTMGGSALPVMTPPSEFFFWFCQHPIIRLLCLDLVGWFGAELPLPFNRHKLPQNEV